MKIKYTLFALCISFCMPALYAQQKPTNKSIIAFGISVSDYNFQNRSKYTTASNPGFGVQLSNWQSIVPHLDFSANLGITFSHFPAGFIKSDSTGISGVTLHADALIHLKAFRNARVNPFITAGAGWGSFGYQQAFYAPLGAGVTFHFNSGSVIILQAQMREPLAKNLINNFMFYSASFAHEIPGTRPKKHRRNRVDRLEVVSNAVSSAVENNNSHVADTTTAKSASPLDSDGDGVPDKDDKCPLIKGSSENEGCPFPLVQGADLAAMSPDSATYRIYFTFDHSELVGQDFEALNNIVKILQADKTLTIHIGGYADTQGTDAKNMKISTDRANVTRDYFLSYNIAASRITVSYYGSSNPVDTVQQWRNRRTEITIIKH